MPLFRYDVQLNTQGRVKGYRTAKDALALVNELVKQYSGSSACIYVEFDCEDEEDLIPVDTDQDGNSP